MSFVMSLIMLSPDHMTRAKIWDSDSGGPVKGDWDLSVPSGL